MNDMSWNFENREPPKNVVTPLARIRWDQYRFRVIDVDEERFYLECSDGTETKRELAFADIDRLVDTKAIVIEHGHFNVDGTEADNKLGDMFSAAPIKDQAIALGLEAWLRELAPDYDAGGVGLYSDPRPVMPNGKVPLNHWIKDKTPAMNERLRLVYRIADPKIPKKPRMNQPTGALQAPGVSRLKEHFASFRAAGFHPVQLLPKYENCGSGSKLSPDTQSVMAQVCNNLLARNTRFTPTEVRLNIAAELTLRFKKKVAGPCHETLARFISTLDQGRIMLAQFGFKKMREKRGSNAAGPTYTRIGEMVYMDCWKVDLVVLLKKTGIWLTMSKPQRKLWGSRRRVWVCIAIDAATRVVLGMAFGLAESPELARRTLRMALSDKTDEAEISGCGVAPPRPIGIEGLSTDSGVAFTHGFFSGAALSVVDHLKVGIVGKPWRRGLIERLFRTTKDQLLAYFSGLTFGNPVAKGDHDAMADASATLEVFGNMMFRFYNDRYRLVKHRGLGNQPPLNRWDETFEGTGVKLPPSADHMLVAFGLEDSLQLTPQGLTYLGIEFKAAWLAKLHGAKAGIFLRVKIDPTNLGRIAVLWKGVWNIVDGPKAFLNVGMTAWKRKRAALAARYGAQAEINFPIVAKALLDIKEMGARERAAEKMTDMTYDDAKLTAEAKSVQLRINYTPTPEQHDKPRAISRGAFGTGFSTSGQGKADVSSTAGNMLDQDEDLPAVTVDDPLAEPGPERDDTAYAEPDVDDGDDEGNDVTSALADTPAKPAAAGKRPRAPKAADNAPTMTTMAELKKGKTR